MSARGAARRLATVMRRVRDEQGGQVIVLLMAGLVSLLLMAAFVVDVGHYLNAQRELQASADAAALAGAESLPNGTAATAAMIAYSGSPGALNDTHPDLTNVVATPTLLCLTTLVAKGVACRGTPAVNAISVTETANVPLFFGGVLGVSSIGIHATSKAAMHGGLPHPINVMLVIDRSGSMNNACTNGGTKLDCARAGALAFLNVMIPSVDKVGLILLPPPTSTGLACSGSSGDLSYDASPPTSNPNYVVVPLSNAFKASDTGPLNNNSPIVKTINCMQAPGGHGSAFAAGLEAAQTELQSADATPGAQNAIVFLSDGQANYGSVYYPDSSTYRTQPCSQTVASAATIAGFVNPSGIKTWVYSIAYDTSSSNICSGLTVSKSCDVARTTSPFKCNELPTFDGYSTMYYTASDPTKFYYQPTPGDLVAAFSGVAADLTTSVLVNDSTN